MNSLKAMWFAYELFLQLLIESFKIRSVAVEQGSSQEVWLCQAVDDPAFFVRFHHYLKASAELGIFPRVVWLNTKLSFRSNGSWKKVWMDRFTQGAFYLIPWKRLYLKLHHGKWASYQSLPAFSDAHFKARSIFSKLKTKEELEKLIIDDLLVGDLIYDTYLRFKPAPTVDLKDPFVLELLEKSITCREYVEKLLKDEKITRVVNTYTSYLQHGIMARAAIRKGVTVHAMGAFNQLVTEPNVSFPYHRRHFLNYRRWFQEVVDPNAAREEGRKVLENRLSGKKDSLTYYMKASAFEESKRDLSLEYSLDSRPKVLLMGHDYFDSPHIYGEMIYPDFLSWVRGCLSFTEKSPYQFLFKPHPNSSQQNVTDELKKEFPNVIFLQNSVSNSDLKNLNLAYVLTVYGTVAYEFAALGFNVICCGDNPHSPYSFSIHVRNREALKKILLGETSVVAAKKVDEIAEFIYVHNYRLERNEVQPFPWSVNADQISDYLDSSRTEIMKKAILDVNSL